MRFTFAGGKRAYKFEEKRVVFSNLGNPSPKTYCELFFTCHIGNRVSRKMLAGKPRFRIAVTFLLLLIISLLFDNRIG